MKVDLIKSFRVMANAGKKGCLTIYIKQANEGKWIFITRYKNRLTS